MFKLKVTKQSLNRVLRDLKKLNMIKQIIDENDTRKKIFLDKDGRIFLMLLIVLKKKGFLMHLKVQTLNL